MSIKTTSRVWENSSQKGSRLLVILAIADHCDDDGIAWPGIERVAAKARISPRQAQRVVQDLEAGGEMYIQPGGGRGKTSLYYVVAGLDAATVEETLIRRFEMPLEEATEVAGRLEEQKKGDISVTLYGENGDMGVTLSDEKGVTGDTLFHDEKGDIQGIKGDIAMSEKGDIAMSPEPSCNHHENRHEGGGTKKVQTEIDHPPHTPQEPKVDYLDLVFAHMQNPDQAGIADPTQDDQRWFQYRDQALKIYHELTGFYPDTRVGKPAIMKLARAPDFDVGRWRKSIETCRLANVKPGNIGCMIDTYHAGGDYREMQQQKNGGKRDAARKRGATRREQHQANEADFYDQKSPAPG